MKNKCTLSFRGAAGDEESRKAFIFRPRFLASLGMTFLQNVFHQFVSNLCGKVLQLGQGAAVFPRMPLHAPRN